MKVKALKTKPNTGELQPKTGMEAKKIANTIVSTKTEFHWIDIQKGRFFSNDNYHPLRVGSEKYYKRVHSLRYRKRKVYWLISGGKLDGQGYHVGFNWWQHQRFLLLQGDHWFQKEENIRYIVNIVFLIIGVLISLKVMG